MGGVYAKPSVAGEPVRLVPAAVGSLSSDLHEDIVDFLGERQACRKGCAPYVPRTVALLPTPAGGSVVSWAR